MFNVILGDFLLDAGYGYEGTKSEFNIGNANINNLKGKIIIICDQVNKNYIDTSFYELINLTPDRDDGPLESYRNYEINFAEERSNILDKTKKKLVIVYPDNTDVNDNKDPENLFNLGCSMILMNYQRLDSNLIKYLNTFGQPQEYSNIAWQSSAFMLKKDSLRDNIKVVGSDNQQCIHEDLGYYVIDIIYENNEVGYRTKVLKAVMKPKLLNFRDIDIDKEGTSLNYRFKKGTDYICNTDGNNDGIIVKIYDGKHLLDKGCYAILGDRKISSGIQDGTQPQTGTEDVNNKYYLNIGNSKKILLSDSEANNTCDDSGDIELHNLDLKNNEWKKYHI